VRYTTAADRAASASSGEGTAAVVVGGVVVVEVVVASVLVVAAVVVVVGREAVEGGSPSLCRPRTNAPPATTAKASEAPIAMVMERFLSVTARWVAEDALAVLVEFGRAVPQVVQKAMPSRLWCPSGQGLPSALPPVLTRRTIAP
jgi:hypothetical protein